MKKLILVRHAKSSWEFDVSDRERPLKNRGLKDAQLVSKEFNKNLISPDVVFSSPANRALSTCRIFLNNLDVSFENPEIIEDLYDFGGHQVVNFLKRLNNDYKIVMIFGHNHAFTSICNIFGDKFIDNLPTSGLAVLNFNIDDWELLEKGRTELMIFPRDLK